MTIIGFCNPLLDITLTDLDSNFQIKSLLTRYELKENDIILADPIRHEGLIDEMISISKGKVSYSPGGAGLNTLRCVQAALNCPGSCRIVGSIGMDHFGQIMQEKSEAIGIQCSFQNTSTKPTGRCACLIRGQDRSLVAFLGAANDFSSKHLDESLQIEIANARFLYITGFFYSVSRESVKRIFSFKCDNSIIFNLSATFVCDGMSREDFAEIMENSYMLIGNSDELMHLNANQGFVDDVNASIEEISLQLSLAFPRTLVLITQGSEPVLLVQAGQVVLRHFVPQLTAKMVVDTNGAGDAFAAGLLVGLERKFQIAESLKLATFMAAKVIQFSGVQPPSKAEIDEFIIKEMKT